MLPRVLGRDPQSKAAGRRPWRAGGARADPVSEEYVCNMGDPELVPLPVGFGRFHRRDFINYQLNRAQFAGLC